MPVSHCERPADYRRGATYALVSAALLAVQEPFSALAAKRLDPATFVAVTQVSLLVSLPLLLARPATRRDFARLIASPRAWPKFAVLLLVGLCGLALYDAGLSSAHPIVTAAVLNLSPFWAAVVAYAVSRKPIPGSPALFFGCFAVAFVGALAIAWSQIDLGAAELARDVIASALHSHWIYALPMPIFFALSGTLLYRWFRDYDESAAVGANFLVSALALIPPALWRASRSGAPPLTGETLTAVALLLIGTLAASAAGRVFYQAALTATRDDNGFVTLFFLIIPGLSALLSWPLSHWIGALAFLPNAMFFAGLALVTAPLGLFVLRQRAGERRARKALGADETLLAE